MKLSSKTINVLRNFSSINANILIKEGNVLSTMAVAKNIIGSVTVDETFPNEIGIFNLSEFLGVLGLMDSPDVEFAEKMMTIKEGKSKLRYVYADASILVYPQKEIKLPSADVKFNITQAQILQCQKAAAALGVQDLAVVGDGANISIQILDKKSDSSNQYTVDLDAESDVKFTAYFKIENFKQIADDYAVELCSKNISKFIGKNLGVTYFIAVESDSKFTGE